MRIFVRKLLFVAVGIGVTLSLLDIFYTWVISETPLHGIRKNEHIDYLIAGDSRTNPLLPEYLCQITGKKVINIGEPGYVLDDNHKEPKSFFEIGNQPARCPLQVDVKVGARDPADVESTDCRYPPNFIRQERIFTTRHPFFLLFHC